MKQEQNNFGGYPSNIDWTKDIPEEELKNLYQEIDEKSQEKNNNDQKVNLWFPFKMSLKNLFFIIDSCIDIVINIGERVVSVALNAWDNQMFIFEQTYKHYVI